MIAIGAAWLVALSVGTWVNLKRRNGSGVLRSEMTEHYATRADLYSVEATLVRWMVGSVLFAVAATASITFAFLRLISS